MPRFLWPLIGRSALIVSTSVVGMPCGKPLYGFHGSVPQQLRRRTQSTILVVIPCIIRRRDINLSPPAGEWPLFARTGRQESNLAPLGCLRRARFRTLQAAGRGSPRGRPVQCCAGRDRARHCLFLRNDPSPSAPCRRADRCGACCLLGSGPIKVLARGRIG